MDFTYSSQRSPTGTKRGYAYQDQVEESCEVFKKTRIIDYNSEIPNMDRKDNGRNRCNIKNCDFCLYGVSVLMKYEMRKQGWKQRLVVAFNSVEKTNPSFGTWHSLNAEIYPFLESHWDALWCGAEREKDDLWKKKIQDCLTHNKDTFESGVSQLGKKGFWRISKIDNKSPYNTISEECDNEMQNAPDSPNQRRHMSSPPSPKRTPKQYYAALPKSPPAPVVIQPRTIPAESSLISQLNNYKSIPTSTTFKTVDLTIQNGPTIKVDTSKAVDISTPVNPVIILNTVTPKIDVLLNEKYPKMKPMESTSPKFTILNSNDININMVDNIRVETTHNFSVTTTPTHNFPRVPTPHPTRLPSLSGQQPAPKNREDVECPILPPILFDTDRRAVPHNPITSPSEPFNFDSEFKRFCERSNSFSPFSRPPTAIRK